MHKIHLITISYFPDFFLSSQEHRGVLAGLLEWFGPSSQGNGRRLSSGVQFSVSVRLPRSEMHRQRSSIVPSCSTLHKNYTLWCVSTDSKYTALGKYCGRSAPRAFTTAYSEPGGSLRFSFHSDKSTEERGFSIQLQTMEYSATPREKKWLFLCLNKNNNFLSFKKVV